MIKKPIAQFLILANFICCLHQNQAQPSESDSLRQVLDAHQRPAQWTINDTSYFNLAQSTCEQYLRSMELDSVASLSEKMLGMLAGISTDRKGFADRLNLYRMQFGRFGGIALIQLGDYPKALAFFQQYTTYAEKVGSVKDIGSSLTYMGYCHRSTKGYELALQYAQKSLAVLKGTPYRAAQANNYTIFATYYVAFKENVDSALYYSKLANQIYHEEKNYTNEVTTLFDIAGTFAMKYQADSSLVYIKKAEPLVTKMNAKSLTAQYHIRMGEAFFIKGLKNESLYHLKLARQLAEELGSTKIGFIANKYLTLSLALNGQTAGSIQNFEETFDVFEDEMNAEKIKELNTAQLNFEFEKKQALADIELQRQKKINVISLIGLVLGFLVALLIFRLYRQSKQTAKILREKNAEVEQSYQALKATQEQLVLTEKQREAQSVRVRIARDIHDELGAGLTKITIMSDLLRKKIGHTEVETEKMLQRIVENAKGVSSSLGEIVWAVNPVHDSLESLANYLKNYASHFLDGTNIQCDFSFPAPLPDKPISPELKRSIFLVLKEALNNAVKYAQADKIWVEFHSDGELFKLQVRDNGIGFLVAEKPQNGGNGNGLPNMKSRMEQLGCNFQVLSAPGDGCTVEAAGKLQ